MSRVQFLDRRTPNGTSREVPLGLMNNIVAYQERGATLREIAAAMRVPVDRIRREVLRWLAL